MNNMRLPFLFFPNGNICLTRIEEEHKKYMHYHNENCFIR